MKSKYKTFGYTKDPGALHLYVKDIRVLTPKEYEILINHYFRTFIDLKAIEGA
jgi:hypothetical protein